ncbi:MAG: monothiol glutaredoxin, Grx4 family [Planctomycetota bacterium]|nr:MAG: monothiol glutaredoxin, Grx4 family [Planctomycetota bacterium]
MWTAEDVKKAVESNKIIMFGKGSKEMPQCGFTSRAIQLLSSCDVDFTCVNIFDDPSIRPALVEYTNWPTTPQVFVDGEFLGGSDIVLELFQNGELQKKIQAAVEQQN